MLRTLTALFALSLATAAVAADAPASSSAASPAVPKPPALAAQDQAPAKPFVYTPKDTDLVTGKADAPVTIVEYASLSCPHCSHFFMNSLPPLTTKYFDTGKAKLVYRDYPLNEPALKAAELVQCVEPERRHAYVKVLFSTQMKWAYDANYREALSNIAVLGGMDRLAFEACMNNKAIEKAVLNVAKEASDDYKVNSTPTFFINGSEYKGDREAGAMGTAINNALATVQTAKPAVK